MSARIPCMLFPDWFKMIFSISQTLDDDDQGSTVRFQFSSFVGHRHGAPPTSILHAILGTLHRARLEFVVDVQMKSDVLDITSLLRSLENPTPASYPANKARRTFSSTNADLSKAFVPIITSWGMEEPRCLSERIRYPEGLSTAPTLTRFTLRKPGQPTKGISLYDRPIGKYEHRRQHRNGQKSIGVSSEMLTDRIVV